MKKNKIKEMLEKAKNKEEHEEPEESTEEKKEEEKVNPLSVDYIFRYYLLARIDSLNENLIEITKSIKELTGKLE